MQGGTQSNQSIAVNLALVDLGPNPGQTGQNKCWSPHGTGQPLPQGQANRSTFTPWSVKLVKRLVNAWSNAPA